MKAAARIPDPEPQEPTPETFLEEIQRILDSGTLRGAREVAERGLALFPDHAELRRLHHALRPFEKARVVPGLRYADPTPSYEWLKKNSRQYLGKWVALDKGELVAATNTYREAVKAVRGRNPREILIHHIL
jgi:hypothetical protein